MSTMSKVLGTQATCAPVPELQELMSNKEPATQVTRIQRDTHYHEVCVTLMKAYRKQACEWRCKRCVDHVHMQ